MNALKSSINSGVMCGRHLWVKCDLVVLARFAAGGASHVSGLECGSYAAAKMPFATMVPIILTAWLSR